MWSGWNTGKSLKTEVTYSRVGFVFPQVHSVRSGHDVFPQVHSMKSGHDVFLGNFFFFFFFFFFFTVTLLYTIILGVHQLIDWPSLVYSP